MTHSVISIDVILLNSMRNGKNCDFSWAKKMGITIGITTTQETKYFILYHILLSFNFGKLYSLRQKKSGFLHIIYTI